MFTEFRLFAVKKYNAEKVIMELIYILPISMLYPKEPRVHSEERRIRRFPIPVLGRIFAFENIYLTRGYRAACTVFVVLIARPTSVGGRTINRARFTVNVYFSR